MSDVSTFDRTQFWMKRVTAARLKVYLRFCAWGLGFNVQGLESKILKSLGSGLTIPLDLSKILQIPGLSLVLTSQCKAAAVLSEVTCLVCEVRKVYSQSIFGI